MQECCYCHKKLDVKVKICPHCGKLHPTGIPFYAHSAIVAAWLACSAEGFWLMHTYTKLPDWLTIPLAPLGVAVVFLLLWLIGD